MKNKSLLFLLVTCFVACKTVYPISEEMKANLQIMRDEDQDIQNVIIANISKGVLNRDSLQLKKKEIFIKNYGVLKKYFKDYGFPGIKEYGKQTSRNFWLLVQHCDNDVNFQKKILKAMKRELKKKNVSEIDYAYLYDRVQKNSGKMQYYGTQMSYDNKDGKPYAKDLEDPENVNERRAKIGLETLESYIESFKDIK